jgi:hypothetical protein
VSTEPDQVLYAVLEPVGDLDGDGYADAIERTPFTDGPVFWRGSSDGYVATGIDAGDVLANRRGLPSEGVDLDGDGYLDFLLSTRYQQSQMFHMAYGAGDLEDVDLQTVYWSDNFWLSSINMTDGGEGHAFLVAAGRSWEEPAPSLRIFTLDREGEIEILQKIFLGGYDLPDMGAMQIYLVDVTGDGRLEIVLERFPNIWQGLDHPLLVFQRDVESETLRYYDEATQLFDRHVRPIGDLNADGRHDYLHVDILAGTAHIVFGPASFDDPLVLGPRVGADDQRITPPPEVPSGTFGDVTGNGFDDIVVGFDEQRPFGENGGFGQIVVEGQGDDSVTLPERRFVDTDFFGPEISFTTNIGDMDGDGIDDFALVDWSGRWPAVHVHLSGSGLQESPDAVLTRPGDIPVGVAGGAFSSDGRREIAVLWQPESGADYPAPATLEIYSSLDSEPNHQIPTDANVAPRTANVVNAGDLNGDGIDDLLVTGNFDAWLFLGGSIETGPHVEWRVSTGFNVVAPLGDVNGDGIADLAISTQNRVMVYFGRDELHSSDFESPDLELHSSITSGMTGFGRYGVAAGDFNGSGYNDIAVLAGVDAFVSSDVARPLHVFFGGPEIDGTVDALAALPEDPATYLRQSDFDCSELVALPGVGGDRDGLLLGSCRTANAYVYVASDVEPTIRAMLGADGAGTLGANESTIDRPRTSAAGDFTGDGFIDVILPRRTDASRPGSSTFLFTIEPIEAGGPTLAREEEHELPAVVALQGNYPNPFKLNTKLVFDVPTTAHVTLQVFDMLGRHVATVVDASRDAGRHSVTFDASGLASGMYLVLLEVGSTRNTQAIMLMN